MVHIHQARARKKSQSSQAPVSVTQTHAASFSSWPLLGYVEKRAAAVLGPESMQTEEISLTMLCDRLRDGTYRLDERNRGEHPATEAMEWQRRGQPASPCCAIVASREGSTETD